MQGASQTQDIRAIVADGADANKLDDYFPLPSKYQMLAFMIPNLWMTDNFIELLSGVPAISMKEQVAKIAPRPILFISAGQGDEQFINRRYCELGGPTTQLWELPDTGHTEGIFSHTKEYIQHVNTFFDENLLEKDKIPDNRR
jgi:hypothetical protein